MTDFGNMVRHDDLMDRRWKRIGDHIEAFVLGEGMTWEAFYETSGVSEATVSKIRRGEAIIRVDKRVAICRALGWSHDSVDRILRGEDPVAAIRPQKQRAGQAEVDRLRRALEAVAERVATLQAQVETNADALLAAHARISELEGWRFEQDPRQGVTGGE